MCPHTLSLHWPYLLIMQNYITLKINKCISYKEKGRFTVRVCIITIIIYNVTTIRKLVFMKVQIGFSFSSLVYVLLEDLDDPFPLSLQLLVSCLLKLCYILKLHFKI